MVEEIDGVDEPDGDGPRLPPLHAAGPRPPRPPRRLPAPLHPHPVDAERRLARAARAHPRGALRGPAGQRHHRLPHDGLPAELPAVLPRPHGPRGRLRARASVRYEDREVWVRSYPLPIDARATRRVAASERTQEFERELLRRRRDATDPARRPRRPLEERPARLQRLRPLPRAAPGVRASGSRSSPSSCRRGPTCPSTPSTSSASRRSSRSSTTATARRTGCRSSSSSATTSRRRSPPTSTTTCCWSTRCSTG